MCRPRNKKSKSEKTVLRESRGLSKKPGRHSGRTTSSVLIRRGNIK